MVAPMNFSIERYKHYFQIPDGELIGRPVYFRKSYEMKKVSEHDKRYYPAEEAESKMFLFDDIIDCTTDNLNKVGKGTRYKIKNSHGEYSVMTD